MHVHLRPTLAMLGVATILCFSVTHASASELGVEQQDYVVAWNSFAIHVTPEVSVICRLTVTGSFHDPTFAKAEGTLIGHVEDANDGDPDECNNGRIDMDGGSLPWHLRYNSFNGELPFIEWVNVDIVGMRLTFQFRVGAFTGNCLLATSQSEPARGRFHVIEGVSASFSFFSDALISIEDSGASILCDAYGTAYFQGTGTVEDGMLEPQLFILS